MKASDVLKLNPGDKLVYVSKDKVCMAEFYRLNNCNCDTCTSGKIFVIKVGNNNIMVACREVEKLSDIIKE